MDADQSPNAMSSGLSKCIAGGFLQCDVGRRPARNRTPADGRFQKQKAGAGFSKRQMQSAKFHSDKISKRKNFKTAKLQNNKAKERKQHGKMLFPLFSAFWGRCFPGADWRMAGLCGENALPFLQPPACGSAGCVLRNALCGFCLCPLRGLPENSGSPRRQTPLPRVSRRAGRRLPPHVRK